MDDGVMGGLEARRPPAFGRDTIASSTKARPSNWEQGQGRFGLWVS